MLPGILGVITILLTFNNDQNPNLTPHNSSPFYLPWYLPSIHSGFKKVTLGSTSLSPLNCSLLGITQGFAPATPDAIYTITRPKDQSTLSVSCAERNPGAPSLDEFAPKALPHSAVETLIDELHSILKKLPMESPPGSEDIYGLGISIAWGSDDLMWCNSGPEGCGGGVSQVKASEEQKLEFKRAVEIIEQIVNK